MERSTHVQRRDFLQRGVTGLAATQLAALPLGAALAPARSGSYGRARSVIVMFCWGGMSHLDTFDMKPSAGSEIRGEFNPVSTRVPGISITEHLPLMGQQIQHLTVVRSVHHQSADHRKAAYWSLTGHPPTNAIGGVVAPQLPSRKDWPSLGAQAAIALREDRRYQQHKRVSRTRPDELPVVPESGIDWQQLRRFKQVSLSTDVLGPGRFPVGTFGLQDGYSNEHTVALIGMIGQAHAKSVPVTRQVDGPRIDCAAQIAGDSTAGDWGSDTHGRGGNLYLIGEGEPNSPHPGFGCHANKFITFDLDAVRQRHFDDTERDFVLTCRVGVNGAPQVAPTAAGQVGVWADGKRIALSQVLQRDGRCEQLEVAVRAGDRYLTLAMLNGDSSTYFDDMAIRDVTLVEVAGELPTRADSVEPEVASQEMSEELAANLPRTISIPYPLADRGILNGQFGGFLGAQYDPVFVHPGRGVPFKGVSPTSGTIDLMPRGVSRRRLAERGLLLDGLNAGFSWASPEDLSSRVQASQNQGINMLLAPEVQSAFDLAREPKAVRQLYGEHVAGQSALLGRRLTDAGVALVTVNLSVGDLNGASGDNWDTHGNNFNRLKNDLLPPWDRAASALLTDLVQSGRIDDTLVVFLTEFGRTPRINGGAGRDHFPNCYTVLFAGAGVQGGAVLGKSDSTGSRPVEAPCTPADIHATVFHALGIPPHFQVYDQEDRPLVMCEGEPLPLS